MKGCNVWAFIRRIWHLTDSFFGSSYVFAILPDIHMHCYCRWMTYNDIYSGAWDHWSKTYYSTGPHLAKVIPGIPVTFIFNKRNNISSCWSDAVLEKRIKLAHRNHESRTSAMKFKSIWYQINGKKNYIEFGDFDVYS